MKKFTLSVCCNCIGTNYPFFRDVAVSSLKQDFSEDVDEHECSNLSSDGRSIVSLILLIGLFLFSNFSAAQVITIDGQTGDWSGNPSVKHVQDAFGNGVVDNQFTEGSKDFLLASNLSWVIGQTKAKNDIANGGFGLANQVKYVDANNVTQTLNGSFLVFAGDRTSNNGDAQIGFWFYLNATAPVEVNGSRYFAPPHVRGDLLVLADFTGGGRLGTVKVYRWIGGGAVTPGSSVVPNTNGNLETTNIASVVAENNAGNSTVPAGWNFTSGQYQANEFYEGFVDLGAIGGNTNFTCSATVLLETRSSQSVTASLDDFIGSTLGNVPTVTVNSPTVCDGQSATITATPGSPGNYTYSWAVPQGANNPGNVASFSATIGGTYSVIITNQEGCPSLSGSGTFTVKPVATVSVNNPSVCNGTSATLTATPSLAGGTYLWNTGATTASITVSPSETTIYSVVYTLNGCPSPSESGTVTVKPVPTVNVNSPSVCNGTSATLTATPSLPGGTYLWNTGASTASITVSPSETTIYSVVYTLDGCPSPSASGTVTVKPVPTVSVNSPSVCNGTSTTLTATPSLPGGTYLWNTGATTASITVTPSETTIYSVVYTLDGCPSPSASGTVTVKPVPTVSVNSPSVCNGTAATLTATPSIQGGTYLWNTGATTASITVSPSSTTIYSVVYTLNGCPSPSASGTVTVKPVPTVSVNSPSVCNGTSATLTATPSLPGGTYLWNTGATTASITVTPSETTIYSVVYTLDGCPSPSASGTATVKPVPTVSVNSPSVCNGTSATLTATPSLPGGTYLWNTGATTASITVSPSSTTTYSVVYTLNGCPSPSASGTVTVKPVPTVSVNSPSVCNGTSATLTATPSLPGGTYLWNTGATTASITVSPSETTTYSVVYTLDGCPSPSASGTVTIKPVPTVSVNSPSVCSGTSATLTATPSLPGGTYLWNTGATTASITVTPSSTTTYSVVYTLNGCPSPFASGTVTIITIPTVTADPKNVCIDGSVNLTGLPLGGTWSGDHVTGSTFSADGLSAGSYVVTYTFTGANNCSRSVNTTITVNALPTVTADAKNVCSGSTVGLTGSPSGGTWSGENVTGNTFNATGLSVGSYTVTYTYMNSVTGCEKSANATVTVSNCSNALCTYTQGYYGNLGGKSCAGGVTYSTKELIAKALSSYPDHKMVIGKAGNSFWMTDSAADIDKIIEILPGGGNSYVLSLGGDKEITTISGSYLKKGTINNTLLAQTITLGLNLGIDSQLGNFELHSGKLAVAEPQGGCGSNIPKPRSCSYGEYTPTINEYKYYDIPAIVNLLPNKTVQGLFEMANKALGGDPLPAGITLSGLANAVDIINNAFDGCKISMGYDQTPLTCIEDRASFVVYPVPIVDYPTIHYNFNYSTNVTIQVRSFNTNGTVVYSQSDVFDGSDTDRDVIVNYNFNTGVPQIYFIRVITNIGSSSKQVISH